MGGLVETASLGLIDSGDITGENAANAAANASVRGAELTAQGQREALDYLKETEALPRQFREGALTQLAGIYGLPGGTGSSEQFIQDAMNSPIYNNLVSRGEEAVLRNASATGGLRSGNVQGALATNAQDALMTAYNNRLQGISGLAQLPSNANNIATLTAAPSATLAQGNIAAAQAQQQQQQAYMNNLFGLGGAGLMALSDIRLKENIEYIGERGDYSWFRWDWRPEAKVLGLEGKSEGVMAHFVHEQNPDAVSVIDGLLCVDYSQLGLIEEAA